MKLPPHWLWPRRGPAPNVSQNELVSRLDQIIASLRFLTAQGTHIMTTLADIQTAETDEATAITGVLAEIGKLQSDLTTAQAAAMQAIVDQIHQNTAKLTAALPPASKPGATPPAG